MRELNKYLIQMAGKCFNFNDKCCLRALGCNISGTHLLTLARRWQLDFQGMEDSGLAGMHVYQL